MSTNNRRPHQHPQLPMIVRQASHRHYLHISKSSYITVVGIVQLTPSQYVIVTLWFLFCYCNQSAPSKTLMLLVSVQEYIFWCFVMQESFISVLDPAQTCDSEEKKTGYCVDHMLGEILYCPGHAGRIISHLTWKRLQPPSCAAVPLHSYISVIIHVSFCSVFQQSI